MVRVQLGVLKFNNMKAKLTFNLPEDQPDFKLAIEGHKWQHVVWQLDQEIRKKLKYDETLTECERKAYSEIRLCLYAELNDQELTFD